MNWTEQLNDYIEKNIPNFHKKRQESLERLRLERILSRKNPYLFKAKHIQTAGELVKGLLDAHLSSQEETIFGDFLEALAIYVCSLSYGGKKSSAEGIDLEFDRDGIRYLVSIKSGPNWGNSSQIKKMQDHFRKARKIIGSKDHVIAVNGCCYGREINTNKGDYVKLCGQPFWELISGQESMYLEIIEPLGHRAKENNELFQQAYTNTINRFTAEFVEEFCTPEGAIDWKKLIAFNSSANPPLNRRAPQGASKNLPTLP